MATKPTIPDLPPYNAGQLYLQPERIPKISRQGVDLASYDDEQLIELRAEIDELLPAKRLKDINLEDELVRQLAVAQALQRSTLEDDACPANQKAQVLNSVAAALAVLGKLQVDVHSSERLKAVEECLIKAIQDLPADVQESFMTRYAQMLEGLE